MHWHKSQNKLSCKLQNIIREHTELDDKTQSRFPTTYKALVCEMINKAECIPNKSSKGMGMLAW